MEYKELKSCIEQQNKFGLKSEITSLEKLWFDLISGEITRGTAKKNYLFYQSSFSMC